MLCQPFVTGTLGLLRVEQVIYVVKKLSFDFIYDFDIEQQFCFCCINGVEVFFFLPADIPYFVSLWQSKCTNEFCIFSACPVQVLHYISQGDSFLCG